MNTDSRDPSGDSFVPPGGSTPLTAVPEDPLDTLLATIPPVAPDPSVWDRIEAEIQTPPAEEPGRARGWFYPMAFAAVFVILVGLGVVVTSAMGSSAVVEASEVRQLTAEDGTVALEISTLEDGTSVATAQNLAQLPEDQTYQLWSVVGDEIVSVGLLGSDPGTSTIRIEGDPAALALSIEVAGGVAVSENPPVALWSS